MKQETSANAAPTSLAELVDGPMTEAFPSEGPVRAAAVDLCEMLKSKELSEPVSSGRIRGIAKKLIEAL